MGRTKQSRRAAFVGASIVGLGPRALCACRCVSAQGPCWSTVEKIQPERERERDFWPNIVGSNITQLSLLASSGPSCCLSSSLETLDLISARGQQRHDNRSSVLLVAALSSPLSTARLFESNSPLRLFIHSCSCFCLSDRVQLTMSRKLLCSAPLVTNRAGKRAKEHSSKRK